MSRSVRLCSLAVATAMLGCARPPQPHECPDVLAGDLVVTEIRGPQAEPLDSLGQWIELYNATDEPIDLRGLELVFSSSTGVVERVLVRAPSLELDPASYAVLGHHADARIPDFVDYSFIADYGRVSDGVRVPKDLPRAGIIELLACGESIDRVLVPALPEAGTWTLDGMLEPSAELNDDPEAWCDDETPSEGQQAQIGIPGTPKERNRSCS